MSQKRSCIQDNSYVVLVINLLYNFGDVTMQLLLHVWRFSQSWPKVGVTSQYQHWEGFLNLTLQFQRYNSVAIATFGAYWELKLLFDVVRSTLRRCCKCDVATSTLWQRCQYNIHGLFGHELTIQHRGNVEATLQFWRCGISVATMCIVFTTLRPNHKHCHYVLRLLSVIFLFKI